MTLSQMYIWHICNNDVFLSDIKLHHITLMHSHEPVNHGMRVLLRNIKSVCLFAPAKNVALCNNCKMKSKIFYHLSCSVMRQAVSMQMYKIVQQQCLSMVNLEYKRGSIKQCQLRDQLVLKNTQNIQSDSGSES